MLHHQTKQQSFTFILLECETVSTKKNWREQRQQSLCQKPHPVSAFVIKSRQPKVLEPSQQAKSSYFVKVYPMVYWGKVVE